MYCPSCGAETHTVLKRTIADPENDAAEMQFSDYQAAIESGDPGEWATTQEVEVCPHCGPVRVYH